MSPEPQPSASSPPPSPRLLADTRSLVDAAPESVSTLWRLSETERQLDANLVHLPAGSRVDTHTEPDLDVMVLIVAGGGVLGAGADDTAHDITQGELLWLPHGSTRSITAGPDGLTYLTVHRRRPGMWIRSAPSRPAGA
jgi:quercetin dioxygenase-like cupin family protein